MKINLDECLDEVRVAAARVLPWRRRSFALNYLDKKLAIHINKKRGFFLEAGGNDGISQSNSLYFEKYLGWTGILVEPIPKLADLCRKNRPRASVIEAALVEDCRSVPTVQMTYCNLMSLVRGARGSEEQDQAHLDRGRRYLAQGDQIEELAVSTTTLSSIIRKQGNPHIDLLSIDVEGFEAQALSGLSLEDHRPDWILVEANDKVSIDKILLGPYVIHDYLSFHDILYRRVR